MECFIYGIFKNYDIPVYVGCTSNFKKRSKQHKFHLSKSSLSKTYQKIKELIGNDQYEIRIIETFNSEKEGKEEKEALYISKYKDAGFELANVNKTRIAVTVYFSPREWKEMKQRIIDSKRTVSSYLRCLIREIYESDHKRGLFDN